MQPAAVPSLTVTAPSPATGIEAMMGGEDGFDFGDFIDIINPLQHLPIIGPIYRELTGDEIAPGPKMAGGFLFGGLIGLAVSAADVLVEEATGRDVGGHVIAALFGDEEETAAPEPKLASAQAAEPLSASAYVASRPYADPGSEAPARSPTLAYDPARAPVPNLSTAAFAALIESFQTADEAEAIPAALHEFKAKASDRADSEDDAAQTTSVDTPPDLADRMGDGLDKLAAIRAQS